MRKSYTLDLDDMFKRMNRAFEEFQDMKSDLGDFKATFPVDMEDQGDKIVVKADLPGFEKEDINLKATSNEIIISAESKEEVHEKKEEYLRRERSTKSCRRRLSMPESVDTESIEAKYENGVLRIELPKKEKKKKKEVKVE